MLAPDSQIQLLHIIASATLSPSAVIGLEESEFGPFTLQFFAGPNDLLDQVTAKAADAVILLGDPEGAGTGDIVTDAGHDAAILVVLQRPEPAQVLAWLERGAQEVLSQADLDSPALPLRLRSAIERKRLMLDARTAYATDLETGLPHQQQLIEHMSQLMALREREPAPMALLALRVEGLATIEARFGREASNVLRRKVGVRLRAGVRASDVVASLGDDHFAVLLGSILTPADAERVGAKLLLALMAPFKVAGADVSVATAIGIGQHPQDGAQPDALLRRALGLAAAMQAQGRAGFSNFGEADGPLFEAANDE